LLTAGECEPGLNPITDPDKSINALEINEGAADRWGLQVPQGLFLRLAGGGFDGNVPCRQFAAL